jgi:ABC-type transport system involved in multi-copper enzyme maturation permease subunit
VSTNIPSTTSEVIEQVEIQDQSNNVFLGRQDYISILFRAIAGELYKLRRRTLSKVLSIIGIAIVVLSLVGISIPAFIATTSTDPAAQQLLSNFGALLHLPGSLTFVGSIANFIATILLIILAGTIVGGEYTSGTIRVMLSRGPSRVQYLLAKIGTLLICTLISIIVLLIIGLFVGSLLNLLLHQPVDTSTMNGAWITHALLYVLTLALSLFFYTILALFIATLGKSSAAGIAGALVWWFLESLLSSILTAVSSISTGTLAAFLKAVPTYLPGTNLSALITNQTTALSASASASQPGAITDVHAILVIIVYAVIFLGISFWVQESRDVTN